MGDALSWCTLINENQPPPTPHLVEQIYGCRLWIFLFLFSAGTTNLTTKKNRNEPEHSSKTRRILSLVRVVTRKRNMRVGPTIKSGGGGHWYTLGHATRLSVTVAEPVRRRPALHVFLGVRFLPAIGMDHRSSLTCDAPSI